VIEGAALAVAAARLWLRAKSFHFPSFGAVGALAI
jgi:hypothetical protein